MSSVLHIWYRDAAGKIVGLQVGGNSPQDALHIIEQALEEGAVSLSVLREEAK